MTVLDSAEKQTENTIRFLDCVKVEVGTKGLKGREGSFLTKFKNSDPQIAYYFNTICTIQQILWMWQFIGSIQNWIS